MNRKLFALVAATFLVMAALSGGTTVAILSDGATVTTTISVGNTAAGNMAAGNTAAGNAPVKVDANVNDPEDRATGDVSSSSGGDEGDTNVQAESSETDDGTGTESEGVSIVLEPADGDGTVTAGENTTYNVVVKGADEGIGAYDLAVELNNSSAATFTDVSYVPSVNGEPATVSGDGVTSSGEKVDMSAGMSSALTDSGDGVVIATVTVEGTTSGETVSITVADTSDPWILDGTTDPDDYNVTGTSATTVDVT
jgi:hypothetical protein